MICSSYKCFHWIYCFSPQMTFDTVDTWWHLFKVFFWFKKKSIVFTMLKVLRLSSVLKRISLFQTANSTQFSIKQHTAMASTSSEDSLNGIIKFLEIVGNLKVRIFTIFNIQVEGWLVKLKRKVTSLCIRANQNATINWFFHIFCYVSTLFDSYVSYQILLLVWHANFLWNSFLAHKTGRMGATKCSGPWNSRWTHVQNEYYDIPTWWEGRSGQNQVLGNG